MAALFEKKALAMLHQCDAARWRGAWRRLFQRLTATTRKEVVMLTKHLRQQLDKLLAERIDQPQMDFSHSTSGKTLDTIVRLGT